MPNVTLFLSNKDLPGHMVKVGDIHLYPPTKNLPRFAALNVNERIERSGLYVQLGMTTIHAETAADLDPLIAGLTRMRELLASAEAVDADNKRAAAEANAAEEQELVEAAERQMDPALHSDSGDVG